MQPYNNYTAIAASPEDESVCPGDDELDHGRAGILRVVRLLDLLFCSAGSAGAPLQGAWLEPLELPPERLGCLLARRLVREDERDHGRFRFVGIICLLNLCFCAAGRSRTAAQGAAINFQVTEVPAGGSLPITRTFVMVPLAGVAFELECLL